MENELQKKIDLLVEMSGSINSYDALIEELNEIEKEIEGKKKEVKNLKKSMKDSKYIRDNDRIIDENIKIGLENKLETYTHQLEGVNSNIESALASEEEKHSNIDRVNSRISSLNSLLETLQNKLKSVHQNPSLKEFYEDMIEKTTKEIEEQEKKKRILNKDYEKTTEMLEQYSNSKNEIEEKINGLNTRLQDTITALRTPNFYIDTYARKLDESNIDILNSELEDLESQRLTIITDPTFLAHEAMEYYYDDDKTSALAQIKDLVAIIKSKPYMTTSSTELSELLEQAINRRDEFANIIDNNNYMGSDDELVEKRIDYLKDKQEKLQKESQLIEEKIIKIDQEEVVRITENLKVVEETCNRLKKEYDEYKVIIFLDDDNKSPRKKASLQAAYHRKKEELDSVCEMSLSYQNELEEAIFESKRLETEELKTIKETIKSLEEEITKLKKKKVSHTKAKDILKIEKDKETLKKLNDDVEAIKHREKYNMSADEIYDEIELSLCKDEDIKENKEEELKPTDFVNLEEFRIENLDNEPLQESNLLVSDEPVINPIPEKSNEVIEEKLDENIIPFFEPNVTEQPVLDILEEPTEFPPRKTILDSDNSNRFKVVNIEPLNAEKKEEQPVINIDNSDTSKPSIPEINTQPTSLNIDDLMGTLSSKNNESEYINFNDLLTGGTDEFKS